MGVLSAITYAVPFFSDICSFDILFFCLFVCVGMVEGVCWFYDSWIHCMIH